MKIKRLNCNWVSSCKSKGLGKVFPIICIKFTYCIENQNYNCLLKKKNSENQQFFFIIK